MHCFVTKSVLSRFTRFLRGKIKDSQPFSDIVKTNWTMVLLLLIGQSRMINVIITDLLSIDTTNFLAIEQICHY